VFIVIIVLMVLGAMQLLEVVRMRLGSMALVGVCVHVVVVNGSSMCGICLSRVVLVAQLNLTLQFRVEFIILVCMPRECKGV
jgi:hypothetical protein